MMPRMSESSSMTTTTGAPSPGVLDGEGTTSSSTGSSSGGRFPSRSGGIGNTAESTRIQLDLRPLSRAARRWVIEETTR